MSEKNVQVNGNGVVETAQFGKFSTPLIDLPVLRRINIPKGKGVSFFNVEGNYIGGIKLSPEERVEAVVQDAQKIYLVSEVYKGTFKGSVAYEYRLRSDLLSSGETDRTPVLSQEPIKIFSETTSCSKGEKIFGNIFDGKTNIPTMVANHPGYRFGYNGAFWSEYNPVITVDLNSLESNKIIENAKNIRGSRIRDKNLISALVPTSKVPSLIKEKGSNKLENVFEEEDLDLVAQLNKARDLDHMCYGDHSCIEEPKFENTSSVGYPKYRLWLDSKGNIYKAKRVFSQDEFSKTLKKHLPKKRS